MVDETNVPVEGGTTTEAPPPSGPGSGRSELRQQLERNFETDRKQAETRDQPPKTRAKAPKRVAGGAEIAPEAPEAAAGAPAEAEGTEAAPEAAQATVAPPEGFSAEAKAEWVNTPTPVQAAVIKREQDMAKGVKELQAKYAEIDKAIAPHLDAIRRTNNSPAKAVEQLFAWFQALSANPHAAFPALAQSFGWDLATFVPQAAAQAAPQPGKEGEQPPALSPEVQRYIQDIYQRMQGMEQAYKEKIGGLENTFAQQSMAKTEEILANWSKGKAHFENVRALMAQLIQSGAVPLNNGQVDLDKAYEMAIYANPDVRGAVLKAQQDAAAKQLADKAAAEKKAQQEQADKARKAAVSLNSTAPGIPGQPGAKQVGKRKSVRESLNEAVESLRE